MKNGLYRIHGDGSPKEYAGNWYSFDWIGGNNYFSGANRGIHSTTSFNRMKLVPMPGDKVELVVQEGNTQLNGIYEIKHLGADDSADYDTTLIGVEMPAEAKYTETKGQWRVLSTRKPKSNLGWWFLAGAGLLALASGSGNRNRKN